MRYSLVILALVLPSAALAQCNPPSAPVGSIGCQPSLGQAQQGDLVLLWRPSVFPESLGQVPVEQLPSAFGGVACTGTPTSSFATNANGIVTHC